MLHEENKKAIVYCRISRDEVEETTERSFAIQARLCKEYAQKSSYYVVGVINDIGSGSETTLPGLVDLITRASKKEFDVVICRDIDRFSRDLLKQLTVESRLRESGICVEYTSQNFDDNEYGRLCRNIMSSVAQFQKEVTVERMNRAKRFKIAQGYVMMSTNKLYGYNLIRTEQGQKLEINESEATIVRLIFKLYLEEKMDVVSIWRGLVACGIKTKTGRGEWCKSSVHKILREKAYTGTWTYGRCNSKRKTNTTELIEVAIPSVISGDVFEQVKARYRSRDKRKRS